MSKEATDTEATLAAHERVKGDSLFQMRQQGDIPAILYGGKAPPESIRISAAELARLARQRDLSSASITLRLKGKNIRAITRETQRDPVRGTIQHIDFLRLAKGMFLAVEVSVRFTGEEDCPGLRRGGVLNIVRHRVELRCPADAIPKEISADLAGRDIGDSVHISDIALPEGARPTISDRDFTVATLVAPAALRGADAEEEEEAAEETATEDQTDAEQEGQKSDS